MRTTDDRSRSSTPSPNGVCVAFAALLAFSLTMECVIVVSCLSDVPAVLCWRCPGGVLTAVAVSWQRLDIVLACPDSVLTAVS